MALYPPVLEFGEVPISVVRKAEMTLSNHGDASLRPLPRSETPPPAVEGSLWDGVSSDGWTTEGRLHRLAYRSSAMSVQFGLYRCEAPPWLLSSSSPSTAHLSIAGKLSPPIPVNFQQLI